MLHWHRRQILTPTQRLLGHALRDSDRDLFEHHGSRPHPHQHPAAVQLGEQAVHTSRADRLLFDGGGRLRNAARVYSQVPVVGPTDLVLLQRRCHVWSGGARLLDFRI